MTGCPKGPQWVAYAAGELAPRLARLFSEHLKVCPACRREVQRIARGLEALDALQREPVLEPETLERLRRRLRVAAAHRPARPRILHLAVRYGWAAAAAVLIAVALLWPAGPTDTPTVAVGNHHAEAIEEIAAAISLLELADNGTFDEYLDRAPTGAADEETDWRLELNDAGLLLDYWSSRDRLRG